MEAKIKGECVEYDYAISSLLSTKDGVMEGVKEHTGKNLLFLGRSKAIRDPEKKVQQLKKRTMFFKFI